MHNDSNYSGTDTNTLSIRQMRKSHAGWYTCLVTNEVKKDGILSKEAQLSVCKFKFICCVDTNIHDINFLCSQLIPLKLFSTQVVGQYQLEHKQLSQLRPQEMVSSFSGRRMVAI